MNTNKNASTTPTSASDEKLNLEIEMLRRELNKSRFHEAFIDKWVPSLIAAIVLFALVPLANYVLWKSQKSIEISNLYLSKRMDLYSEVASNSLRFIQLILRLNELYDIRGGKLPKDPFLTMALDNKSAELNVIELEKERLRIEPVLIKAMRDIKLYFGPDASSQVDSIRGLYNSYGGKRFDATFVRRYQEEYDKLALILEKEIRQGLGVVEK